MLHCEIIWSNKLNCLVVGIPESLKEDIDRRFNANINTVVHISKTEVKLLRYIGRSRFLFMQIFNKYLIQIGKPIILKKALKYPFLTNKNVRPDLIGYLKVLRREMQKEEFRECFLEFLGSDFLKDHIQNKIMNSNVQTRLLILLSAFEKCIAQDKLLIMFRKALKMDMIDLLGNYFESYAFYSNARKDQWVPELEMRKNKKRLTISQN